MQDDQEWGYNTVVCEYACVLFVGQFQLFWQFQRKFTS